MEEMRPLWTPSGLIAMKVLSLLDMFVCLMLDCKVAKSMYLSAEKFIILFIFAHKPEKFVSWAVHDPLH